MAVNGFILFIGASIGPIIGSAITGLSSLAIVLVGLLALAALSLSGVPVLNRKAAQS